VEGGRCVGSLVGIEAVHVGLSKLDVNVAGRQPNLRASTRRYNLKLYLGSVHFA
jgi:hypothetical protein